MGLENIPEVRCTLGRLPVHHRVYKIFIIKKKILSIGLIVLANIQRCCSKSTSKRHVALIDADDASTVTQQQQQKVQLFDCHNDDEVTGNSFTGVFVTMLLSVLNVD